MCDLSSRPYLLPPRWPPVRVAPAPVPDLESSLWAQALCVPPGVIRHVGVPRPCASRGSAPVRRRSYGSPRSAGAAVVLPVSPRAVEQASQLQARISSCAGADDLARVIPRLAAAVIGDPPGTAAVCLQAAESADIREAVKSVSASPHHRCLPALCKAVLAARTAAALDAASRFTLAAPIADEGGGAYGDGDEVVAEGLVGAAVLNGLRGVVVKGETQSGRVGVNFGGGHGTKAIKPSNLRPADTGLYDSVLGAGGGWERVLPAVAAAVEAAIDAGDVDVAARAVGIAAVRRELLAEAGMAQAAVDVAVRVGGVGSVAALAVTLHPASCKPPDPETAAAMLQHGSEEVRNVGAWAARLHLEAGTAGEGLAATARSAVASITESPGPLGDAVPLLVAAAARMCGGGVLPWTGDSVEVNPVASHIVQCPGAIDGLALPLWRLAVRPLSTGGAFMPVHGAAGRSAVLLLRVSAPGQLPLLADGVTSVALQPAGLESLVRERDSRQVLEAVFDVTTWLLDAGADVLEPVLDTVARAALAVLPGDADDAKVSHVSSGLSRAAACVVCAVLQQERPSVDPVTPPVIGSNVFPLAAAAAQYFMQQSPLCVAAAVRLVATALKSGVSPPSDAALEAIVRTCLVPALRRVLADDDSGAAAKKSKRRRRKRKSSDSALGTVAAPDSLSARTAELICTLLLDALADTPHVRVLATERLGELQVLELIMKVCAAAPFDPVEGMQRAVAAACGTLPADDKARRLRCVLASGAKEEAPPDGSFPALLRNVFFADDAGAAPTAVLSHALSLLWAAAGGAGQNIPEWPREWVADMPDAFFRSCASAARLGDESARSAAAVLVARVLGCRQAVGCDPLSEVTLACVEEVLLAGLDGRCGFAAAAEAASADLRLVRGSGKRVVSAAIRSVSQGDPGAGAQQQRLEQLWAATVCDMALAEGPHGAAAVEDWRSLVTEEHVLFAGNVFEVGKLPPPFTLQRARRVLTSIVNALLLRFPEGAMKVEQKVGKRLGSCLKSSDEVLRKCGLTIAQSLLFAHPEEQLKVCAVALQPAVALLVSGDLAGTPQCVAAAHVVCAAVSKGLKGALAALEPRPAVMARIRATCEGSGDDCLRAAVGVLEGIVAADDAESLKRREAEKEMELERQARQLEAEEKLMQEREVLRKKAQAEAEAKERREEEMREQVRRKLEREKKEREKAERKRRQAEEEVRRQREKEEEEKYRKQSEDAERREAERKERARITLLEDSTVRQLAAFGVTEDRAFMAMRGVRGYDLDALLEWLVGDTGSAADAPRRPQEETVIILGSGAVKRVAAAAPELTDQQRQADAARRRAAAQGMGVGAAAADGEEDDYEPFWMLEPDLSKNRRAVPHDPEAECAPEEACSEPQDDPHPLAESRRRMTPWHKTFAALLDLLDFRANKPCRLSDVEGYLAGCATEMGYADTRHYIEHAKTKGLITTCTGQEPTVSLTQLGVRYHRRFWDPCTGVPARQRREAAEREERERELERRRKDALEALLSWKPTDAVDSGDEDDSPPTPPMPEWWCEDEPVDEVPKKRQLTAEEREALELERMQRRHERWVAFVEGKRKQGWGRRPARRRDKAKAAAAAPAAPVITAAERERRSREAEAAAIQLRKQQRAESELKRKEVDQRKRRLDQKARALTPQQRVRNFLRRHAAVLFSSALLALMVWLALTDPG